MTISVCWEAGGVTLPDDHPGEYGITVSLRAEWTKTVPNRRGRDAVQSPHNSHFLLCALAKPLWSEDNTEINSYLLGQTKWTFQARRNWDIGYLDFRNASFMPSSNLSGLSLAIVCPMANEGETAAAFVDAVLSQSRDFGRVRFLAILDKATKDNTRELLEAHQCRAPELTVVWAPENRGVVDAYLRGYREALAMSPDWILEIDAGFSHQPTDIPVLLAKISGDYDCIFGSRFCRGGSIKKSSLKRYGISWGGTLMTNLLLGTKLSDMTSGFQLFKRETLQMLVDRGIRSRGPFFQTEMKTYCRHLRIAEVPIHYRAASHAVGKKAINDAIRNLGRLFRLRLTGQV